MEDFVPPVSFYYLDSDSELDLLSQFGDSVLPENLTPTLVAAVYLLQQNGSGIAQIWTTRTRLLASLALRVLSFKSVLATRCRSRYCSRQQDGIAQI